MLEGSRPNAGRTVCVHRAKRHVRSSVLRVACAGVLAIVPAALTTLAYAEHEIDHRFVIEGFVCKSDGQAASDVEVVARDTRASLGKAEYTDSSGHYRIQLHLHNDNAGDPVVVSTGGQEQKVRAQFDPKDMKTERKVTVTFGSGCERSDQPANVWLYYGVGIGLVAAAVVAGARLLNRKAQRTGGRGKKPRK